MSRYTIVNIGLLLFITATWIWLYISVNQFFNSTQIDTTSPYSVQALDINQVTLTGALALEGILE